jgi:hypothetical protein
MNLIIYLPMTPVADPRSCKRMSVMDGAMDGARWMGRWMAPDGWGATDEPDGWGAMDGAMDGARWMEPDGWGEMVGYIFLFIAGNLLLIRHLRGDSTYRTISPTNSAQAHTKTHAFDPRLLKPGVFIVYILP